jgi:hypothetical protein
MERKAICYVVRDVTGERQLSVRFTIKLHAQSFADQCAEPVRIWRIVTKVRPAYSAATDGDDHCPNGVAPTQIEHEDQFLRTFTQDKQDDVLEAFEA